jgi:hypothetical protein
MGGLIGLLITVCLIIVFMMWQLNGVASPSQTGQPIEAGAPSMQESQNAIDAAKNARQLLEKNSQDAAQQL